MSASPTPSRLPSRVPSTAPQTASIPRSVSDSSYASTYGLQRGAATTAPTGNGSPTSRSSGSNSALPRSTSSKSLSGPSSSLPSIRSLRSRFQALGGGGSKKASKVATGPKIVVAGQEESSSAVFAAPEVKTLVATKGTTEVLPSNSLHVAPEQPASISVTPGEAAPPPPSPTRSTTSPNGRPKSIGGGSIGRKSGVFSFGRKSSISDSSPPVAPRFQKQVQRPSVESVLDKTKDPDIVTSRTPPAKVALIRSASKASLSATLLHEETAPDVPTFRQVPSPANDASARSSPRASTRNSTRSPIMIAPGALSPNKRDSSLRLANPSPVPIRQAHTTAKGVDAWVHAEQLIETPRRTSSPSVASSHPAPSTNGPDGLVGSKSGSSMSSLMRQAPPDGVANDLTVPNNDDLAFRSHSISPVLGGPDGGGASVNANASTSPNLSASSPNLEPGSFSGGRRSRGGSPLPHDLAEIRAKSSSGSDGQLVSKPVAIPAIFQRDGSPARTETLKPRSVSRASDVSASERGMDDVVSNDQPRSRTQSQDTALALDPMRSLQAQPSIDTFGEPRRSSLLLEGGGSRRDSGSSTPNGETSLRRSLSAIDAARRNPAAAMRNVETGSPVLVRASDERFSDGPSSRRGSGSIKGSGLLESTSAINRSERSPRIVTGDMMGAGSGLGSPRSPEGKVSTGSRLASPLDDLVYQLGGRRPSDRSSVGRPNSASFTALGANMPENAIADTSPLLAASSPSSSLQPVISSGDEGAYHSAAPDPDGPLTLDQMEREIARMEVELALAGGAQSKRFATLGLGNVVASSTVAAATPPRQKPNKSIELANALGNSTHPYSIVDPATLSIASSSVANLSSYELERNPSQSSSITNEITPRTARRWSIVEVERAYERMKRILASASSKSLTAMSDSGTINESASEMGDVAVEDAFETALARARARDTPARAILGDPEEDDAREELLMTPPSQERNSFLPTEQTTPTGRSSGLRDLKLNSPSARAARLSISVRPSSGTSDVDRAARRRLSRGNDEVSIKSLDHAPVSPTKTEADIGRASRPYVMHEAPPKHEDDEDSDVFGAVGSTAEAGDRHCRGRDASPNARTGVTRFNRRGTAESAKSITGASETGSEDGGWATPLSSSTAFSRFGNSIKSPRATGALRGLSSPARSTLLRRSVDDFGRNADGHKMASETTPKRHSLLVLPVDRSLGASSIGSEGKAPNGTWYPSTPGRAEHRRPISRSSSSTNEHDSANETSRTLVDPSNFTMTNVREMDKLEVFFKYTAAKAELDKAVLERDALLDALGETRSTLIDVRAQRDTLQEQLRVESADAGEKKISSDPTLASLKKSRATWEARALDTAEELERSKEELFALRQELVESRSREDSLEREVLNLQAKVATMEAKQVTLAAGATSLARRASSGGANSPRGGGSPRAPSSTTLPPLRLPRQVSADEGNSSPSRMPASPIRAVSRVDPSAFDAPPTTPAARLAHAYRVRNGSVASSAGGASEGSEGLVDATVTMLGKEGSSPLMEQRATFGAKSSFGSFAGGSPIKTRSLGPSASEPAPLSSLAGGLGASPMSNTLPKPRAKSRLPFPSFGSPKAGRETKRRVSKSSVASSATASDYGGDHLPPSTAKDRERAWNPRASVGSSTGSVGVGKLREDDEKFLKDLLLEEE